MAVLQDFTFTINVSADGATVEGTVTGMTGHKCSDVSKILNALGQELEHRHTGDYAKTEPVRIGAKPTMTIGGGWKR